MEIWIFEVYVQNEQTAFSYVFIVILYVFEIKYSMFGTFAGDIRLSWNFAGDQGSLYSMFRHIYKIFRNFCDELGTFSYFCRRLYVLNQSNRNTFHMHNSRPICHMEMIYYKILRIFLAVTQSFPWNTLQVLLATAFSCLKQNFSSRYERLHCAFATRLL